MTFDEWKITDEIKSHSEVWEDINLQIITEIIDDFDEAHVYPEGSWFVRINDTYYCHCARSEIETSDIEEVRKFLWDNHAKYELGYHLDI